MNWDRIEGQWKQRRGKAVHRWGKVMNDELAAIAGKHEQLVGILQEKYGVAKEEAKRQVSGFKKIVKELKKSNAALIRIAAGKRKKSRGDRTTSPSKSRKKTRSGSKRGSRG
jgi:uncharacterized protein YjbJ (UPF0337 family)